MDEGLKLMNRYPLWRYLLLLCLIVAGLIYAAPNLYSEDPAVQLISKDSGAIKASVLDSLKAALEKQGIEEKSITLSNHSALIRFNSSEDQLKAQDIIQASIGTNYSVALNLAPRTPTWLSALGASPMKLGLDLRGGIHFLLDVDVNALIKANQLGDMHGMGKSLRTAKVRYSGIIGEGGEGVLIRFRDAAAMQQALPILKKEFPTYIYKQQEIDGQLVLRATVSPETLTQLRNYAVDQNLNILRTRVNELGVAEPVIQRQGSSQISVDLPGIQDTARAKDLIGKVASIRWQFVDTDHDAEVAARTGNVPFGDKLFIFEKRPILVKNEVILKGSAITNASTIMGDDGRAAVSVRVGGSGDSSFNRITGQNVGKPLSVIYVETKTIKSLENGKLVIKHKQIERIINVATVQSALGNNFQITGLESMQYAKNLVLLLRSGAYSAPVDFVQERVVGPSLGKENIHKGVLSLEIGSLFVILFMAVYYRLFGLVANLALILNIVFIVAILSMLGATLTLPAIAGIVLTVGMAVDANVLINERIREELRIGMSPQASIYSGYERAFSTIVDANVTTLIVAVVLLALGSGSVQGFAVTLIIGLLTSMITAIFFTRALINLIYGRRQQIKYLSIGIRV
jgi:preprotein translocase subunit SecD